MSLQGVQMYKVLIPLLFGAIIEGIIKSVSITMNQIQNGTKVTLNLSLFLTDKTLNL